jgi:mycothiol synthase
MSLHVREFDPNRDSEAWIAVRNQAWTEDPEHFPWTVEDLRKDEQAPWSRGLARFVAELDGCLVGSVSVNVDPERTDRKAFMNGPAVIPAARRKGVGTALAKRALEYLAGRGMEQVRAWVLTLSPEGSEFLTSLGFEPVRWFSRMRRSLGDVPPDAGKGIELVTPDESDASIALLVRLNNEAFGEHFDYRPVTAEMMRYFRTRARRDGMELETCVARINGTPAGFLAFGIDPREIKQRGRKVGWLHQLGVLKPFRGQGVATTLIIAGMNWLKSRGMEEAELNVDDANPSQAIRLYERLGFTVARKSVLFLKKLDR